MQSGNGWWRWMVITAVLLMGATAFADDEVTPAPAVAKREVAKLIEELGSPHYATRERAAADLAEMGLEAFDALHAAQNHSDIEIAERARYLLHSMDVNWARPGDSPDVKRLLKEYGRQNEAERRSRIEQLAALDDAAGLDALCRLVRYDLSTTLAKEAVVLLMSRPTFQEAKVRAALKKSVAEQVGPSKRTAAQWLTTYVKTLDEPAAKADEWKKLIGEERQRLVQFGDKETSNKIVRDLYRWQAEYLQGLGRESDAIDSVRQMIALSDGSREQLVEIIDWLMQRKAWPVVDEVAEKHPEKFNTDPLLLYRLAEAQAQRGQQELADKTAERAFALAPGLHREHLILAFQLQERGRTAWAEREFRNVVAKVELLTREGIEARSMLAEMLHDQERDREAADALGDIVKLIESSEAAADNVSGVSPRRSPQEIQSRMYFFAATDHMAKGENDKAKAALEKGSDANSEDADLLIAMHRLPDADDAWKKKTQALINQSAAGFKNMIDQMQRIIEESDHEQQQAEAKVLQAMFCNQYAWLVGNTEGDVQEAIRLSRRSIEIRPDAGGYMDTLAHCYHRAGDHESAIKWQLKALALEPHSGQMTRALKKFEATLAEKKKQP